MISIMTIMIEIMITNENDSVNDYNVAMNHNNDSK